MTNEELTAEVAQLEHFLFDVWRWDDLLPIADQLDADAACPVEGWDNNAEVRKLRQQLDAILLPCYDAAIDKVNDTLSRLDPGPLRSAALGRIVARLKDLQQPGGCYEYWNRLHYFKKRTGTQYEQDLREVWAAAEQDIGHYVGLLVAHIEGHSAEVEQAGPLPLDRPGWTGSAAELAYLLTELVEAEHLIPPARGRKKGKDGNRAAIAEAIYRAFDIRDRDTGEPVTLDYFKSLLRPNSPDRGAHTNLFKIRPRTAAK
jgi:hypothetical protein